MHTLLGGAMQLKKKKTGAKGKAAGGGELKNKDKSSKVFYSRRYQRVPLEMEVEYRDGENFVKAKSRNISQGGMFIESRTPLPDGGCTRVRFVIEKDRDAVELEGKVAWSCAESERKRETAPTGMGVEFIEKDGEKRELVGRFVRDLTDLLRIMAITGKRKRDN